MAEILTQGKLKK